MVLQAKNKYQSLQMEKSQMEMEMKKQIKAKNQVINQVNLARSKIKVVKMMEMVKVEMMVRVEMMVHGMVAHGKNKEQMMEKPKKRMKHL